MCNQRRSSVYFLDRQNVQNLECTLESRIETYSKWRYSTSGHWSRSHVSSSTVQSMGCTLTIGAKIVPFRSLLVPSRHWWNSATSVFITQSFPQHCDSLLPRAITASTQTTPAVQPYRAPNKPRHWVKSVRKDLLVWQVSAPLLRYRSHRRFLQIPNSTTDMPGSKMSFNSNNEWAFAVIVGGKNDMKTFGNPNEKKDNQNISTMERSVITPQIWALWQFILELRELFTCATESQVQGKYKCTVSSVCSWAKGILPLAQTANWTGHVRAFEDKYDFSRPGMDLQRLLDQCISARGDNKVQLSREACEGSYPVINLHALSLKASSICKNHQGCSRNRLNHLLMNKFSPKWNWL